MEEDIEMIPYITKIYRNPGSYQVYCKRKSKGSALPYKMGPSQYQLKSKYYSIMLYTNKRCELILIWSWEYLMQNLEKKEIQEIMDNLLKLPSLIK